MIKKTLGILGGIMAIAGVAFGGNTLNKYFTSADKVAESEVERIQVKSGEISITLPEQSLTEIASTPWESVKKVNEAPLSESDYTGEWIHTFESLTSNMGDGGSASTITQIAGTDSVLISSLWITSARVKAKLDKTTGKLTIPVQIAFTDVNYGPIYISPSNAQDGTPDKTREIEGTVTADGISIPGIFGMYVASEGEYKDAFLGVCFRVKFVRPNAHMSATSANGTSRYGVIIEQTSANTLKVMNFANFGREATITLTRNKIATIPQQVIREDAAGEWVTIGNPVLDGSKLSYRTIITSNEVTNPREITWGGWSMLATDRVGTLYTEGKLELPFDVKFPTLSVTSLTGKGTKENPYLITCTDELVIMADSVNNNNNFNIPTSVGVNVSRTFENKYFRLENDVDMAGYTFEPIGKDYYHRFNGIFDGNGHKIKNLTVSTGVNGYAGLFGYMDSLSYVKDLTFVDADVKTSGFACGVLGAYSLGRVTNCHSINPVVESKSQVVGGLLGSGYNVDNCSTTGVKVTSSNGLVAALAGQIRNSISNCFAKDGDVLASSPAEGAIAGGLVGSLYISTATDCWFSGTVDSNSTKSAMYIGGIAGVCFCSTIERCFSVGRIMGFGQLSKCGGVTGYLMGTLRDCYSAGTVESHASYNTGGITGTVEKYQLESGEWRESEIHNCYTSVYLDAEKSYYNPATESRETLGRVTGGSNPVLENIYGDRRMADFKSEKYGSNTDEMTSAKGLPGFDSKVWLFTEGQYPRLRGLENTTGSDLSASVFCFKAGSTIENVSTDIKINKLGATDYKFIVNGQFTKQGHFAEVKGDSLILNKDYNIGTDTLYVSNGDSYIIYMMKIAPKFLEGEGTEANPYLIKTKNDLILLADAVTVKGQLFADTYFRIANDIDMEYDQNFIGIGAGTSTANKFSGILDGGGHTIHRMRNHWFEWITKPEDSSNGLGTPSTSINNPYRGSQYAGLIGRLALDGVVRNVIIGSDCEMISFSGTGAIVGDNYGLIENCVNEGTVKTFSMRAAGIAGSNQTGGIIRNCLNTGKIQCGYFYAGGIVAQNGALVENCVNVGDVECVVLSTFQGASSDGHKYAGGIAANSVSGTYKNVVNYGSIYTYSGITGGIVARLDGTNAVDCGLNVGIIDSKDKVNIGAIGGSTGSKATQKGYWDASLQPLRAACNSELTGLEGLPVSQLISGKPLDGFDSEVWDFTQGMYPVLKIFANHKTVAAARKVVVKFPDDCRAVDFTSTTPLNTDNGLSWKLKYGTAFKINNNQITLGSITKSESDTLIANYGGGYVKKIYLQANLPLPLEGVGTQAAPYLIKTVDDWNALASWMTSTGSSLTGKFISLEADLDFTNKKLTPVCGDNVTFFGATFIGNNKKISGVKINTTADYQGIFGTIGTTGEVRDLEVSGTIDSQYQYTGGVVGRVYGKLTNIIGKMNVSSTKHYIGGVVGLACAGSNLTNCVHRGIVSGSMSYIAGVCSSVEYGGYLESCGNEGQVVNCEKGSYTGGVVAISLPSTFKYCYNKGVVEIQDKENAKVVGGIIAYANGTSSTPNQYTIKGCYNVSELYAYSKIGGIVGITGTVLGGNKMNIDSCYNTGHIYSVSTKADNTAPTAGIIALYSPGSTIRNSYNTGIIESDYNLGVGGIAGLPSVTVTSAYPVNIVNCYNEGVIKAINGNGGGIIANQSSYTHLQNCHNSAAVYGGQSLGGLVGVMGGNGSTLYDCYNTGDVTGSANRVGGLIGAGTGGTASYPTKINCCWNSGNVSTTLTTGGVSTTSTDPSGFAIGGLAGQSRSQFANCYNTGEVKGASQVGGLVGQPMKALTTFTRCYNTGKLVAAPDTCGNIVGVNTRSTRYFAETNTVENVYYLKENKVDNDLTGEAVNESQLASLKLGSAWYETDDYTFPLLKDHEKVPHAAFHAARAIFAEDEKENIVTKPFKVGRPEVVTWTIDAPGAAVEGNDVKFHKDYKGNATLTMTCGELKREYKLTLDVINGVEAIYGDKAVIEELYFDLSGVSVAKPQYKDGKVYIVVVKYEDGTIKSFKLLNN